MPGKPSAVKYSVFMAICLVAIAMAAAKVEDFEASTSRKPASLSKKEMILGEVKPDLMKHTHKLRGPLSASIEMLGAAPEREGDVFVLEGYVQSLEEVKDVEFKWALPEGVEVISGELSGVISVLTADVPHKLQITLKQKSSDNHQVHLITSARNQVSAFADSAQFNTLLQPVINASKEELRKSTERELANEKRIKVFH